MLFVDVFIFCVACCRVVADGCSVCFAFVEVCECFVCSCLQLVINYGSSFNYFV